MATLRPVEVFSDSAVTVFAIESVTLRQSKTDAGCRVYGSIEPIALIVSSAEGTYALDMEAKRADLEQLGRDTPDLDLAIAPR